MLSFTNPDTERSFELLLEKDQNIWIPACEANGRCYDGPFTGMTPRAAEKYVAMKGKWVRPRQAAAAEVVAPPPEDEPPADDEQPDPDE